MTVEIRREPLIEERYELVAQVRATSHPLKVVSPAVMIRAVQTSTGEGPLQPPEDRLVPDVHPQRHLGLAAVAAEVAFSDQKPDEEPDIELRWHGHPPLFHRHVTRETSAGSGYTSAVDRMSPRKASTSASVVSKAVIQRTTWSASSQTWNVQFSWRAAMWRGWSRAKTALAWTGWTISMPSTVAAPSARSRAMALA